MIKVRFFGMLRLALKVSSVEVEAESIKKLLEELQKMYNIDSELLKGTVIFVNDKNMNELQGYKTRLTAGDTVMFLSPVSGG